jgi:hypothetical protein
MMRSFLLPTLLIILLAVTVPFASSVTGTSLQEPRDSPILTISGKIRVTNKGQVALFDRAMLESLGLETIETTTPWFKGLVKFEGVPLSRLLETVGAAGDKIVATAINDYSVTIPIEDFGKYGVILALKRNGEYMTVSNKGPSFIVYPYDRYPELHSQKFYARSAWQVTRLMVE